MRRFYTRLFVVVFALILLGLGRLCGEYRKHQTEQTSSETVERPTEGASSSQTQPSSSSETEAETTSEDASTGHSSDALDIPETPVDSTVLLPDGQAPDSGWPTVVLMHGYRGNPEDVVPIARLARDSAMAAIVLPAPIERGAGHYHWKLGHPSHTHRYLQHHLERIARTRDVSMQTSHVWLVGFSQGGLHGLHLVAKHPDRYRGLFAISPAGWTDVPDEIEHPEETRRFVITGGKREPDKYRQTFLDTRTLLKSDDLPLEIVDHDQGHEFPPDWRTLARETFQTWRRADAE